MAVYNITVNGQIVGVIDTQGNSQPISAATNPCPFAQSVPAGLGLSSSTGAADIKTATANTNQPIANRS